MLDVAVVVTVVVVVGDVVCDVVPLVEGDVVAVVVVVSEVVGVVDCDDVAEVVCVLVAVVVVSMQLSHMTGQCARTNSPSTSGCLHFVTLNRPSTPQSAGSCSPLQTPFKYVVVTDVVPVVVVVGVVVVV